MKINIPVINEIRRLISVEFKSDNEIMQLLKIPRRTYFRYKKRIYKEDRDSLRKTTEENVEHDLMQVRRTLEYIIENCIKIIESPDAENRDKIQAMELLGRAAYAKVDALYGPTKVKPVIRMIERNVKNSK
jgi:hypothetical protein